MRHALCWVGLLALLATMPAQLATAQSTPGDLSDRTFKKWSEFIQPEESECAWEAIGWRTDLEAAMTEAKELGRPILLWAMNGHPCGLT